MAAEAQTARRGPGRPTNAEREARAISEALAKKANIQARYDAAGTGKRVAGWNPPTSGPNRAIVGLQKIRDRSHDNVRNEWTGASSVQKWATTLVGIGIVPRFKRIKVKERKQQLTDQWDDFVAASDADGVLNLYGQMTLTVRGWFDGGEMFIRRRARSLDAGYPVPLQVQLLEAEFVPMLDATTYTGLPPGNEIRSGIEFDKRGQRIAYWMYKSHPNDPQNFGRGANPEQLIRVPARDVIHLFEPKRAGQIRGVPESAPILTQVREIGNYRDAVLLRQQLSNLFVAFLTRKTGNEDDETDPLTGRSIKGTFDKPIAGMTPGIIQELEDGQDVKFANPPEAGTTFSDYLRTELLGPAAGQGLPYELFSGDIREVSDRTLRIVINEFRRLAEQRQWQILIPMLCRGVLNWWVEASVLASTITLDEVNDVRRAEWSPHGWAPIHPVQDPTGQQIEIDMGVRSRSSVIAAKGDDPDDVDDERQADDERERALKIGPYSEGAKQKAAAKQKFGQPPTP